MSVKQGRALIAGRGDVTSKDNITITNNANDELQAVAKINQNPSTSSINYIYDWVGTLDEYYNQDIANTHPEWICFITDDTASVGTVYTKAEMDVLLAQKADNATTLNGYGITNAYTKSEVDDIISSTLEALYPIGSIYIGTQSTCPLATLISGSTWEKVAQDRSLQGSSNNHAATDEISAGLPNITGSLMVNASTRSGGYSNSSTGAFYPTELGNPAMDGGDHSANGWSKQNFDASRSSAIYGASTTVQPPAYVTNIWRRTA